MEGSEGPLAYQEERRRVQPPHVGSLRNTSHEEPQLMPPGSGSCTPKLRYTAYPQQQLLCYQRTAGTLQASRPLCRNSEQLGKTQNYVRITPF